MGRTSAGQPAGQRADRAAAGGTAALRSTVAASRRTPASRRLGRPAAGLSGPGLPTPGYPTQQPTQGYPAQGYQQPGYPTQGYPQQSYPAPGQPPPPGAPWQPAQPGGYQQQPGYPYPGPVPPPVQAKRHTKATVLTVAAVLVLILVATITAGLLVRAHSAGEYAVGSCVTHSGGKPRRVGCDTQGAYRVAAKVTDPGQCDPGLPYIEVDHSPKNTIFCLQPVSK